ncbi:InlB B-repeat-containing protein [Nocardioides sp. Bht2]|uniref:InlB B-repeat-containing protein n=1 Tax=Nocardioides sp. Bht2 TaxID=3392297 RepID=UPI0039B3EB0B
MSRRNLRAAAVGLLVLAVLCGSAAAPLERASADSGCPPAGQLDDNEQSEPGHGDGTEPGGVDPEGESATRFAVTYAAGTGGKVTGDLTQRVVKGADATPVTAVPDAGHTFVDWSDGVSTARRHDRDVSAKIVVEARFSAITYDLTYAAGPNGTLGGTTAQTVAHGTDGTAVTAVPDTGYEFVRWSDGSTDNPRADRDVRADLSVTAEFAVSTYRVRYLAGTGGNITGDADQNVRHGDDATAVTAAPDTGYEFVRWSDGSATNPRTDVALAADLTVTAEFARLSYDLTYTAGPGGTLSGDLVQSVEHGDDGTAVSAAPSAGQHFLRWSDGSTGNPRTDLNVTADLAVTAIFEVNTYALTYLPGTHGTVAPSAPATVEHGDDGPAVSVTPNTGYRFVRWSDGVTANPRTDLAVGADLTVTAEYELITYTVRYLADSGGSIGGAATQTVGHGSNSTVVTAVPDVGHEFLQWGDGNTDATRSDGPITADMSITAFFATSSYTLAYTAGTGGTISGTATQYVNHGSDGNAITAVPDTGYRFVRWSDGSTANPRTDLNVVSDLSVSAVFEKLTYTLTYTADTGGTLTGTASQTVEHGEDGTAVTAVPDDGYAFVQWSDGVTANPRTDTGVTASLSVSAEFANAVVLPQHGDAAGAVPAAGGQLKVKNTDAAAAEYLLVPTNMSGSSLAMTTSITGNVGSAIPGQSGSAAATTDADATRRRNEVAIAEAARGGAAAGTPLVPAAGVPAGVVPAVGDTWRLNREMSAGCATGTGTNAVVKAVGDHAILVGDAQNPAYSGGLAPLDTETGYYNELLKAFDETIYPAVTGAFGAPSDVDGNDRVVIFVTRGLNELAPPASSAVVSDLVRPLDLLDKSECALSNEGEVIYLLAPDATGAVNSNVRTASFANGASLPGMARQLGLLIHDGARLDAGAVLDGTWLSMALGDAASERAFYGASVGLTPLANILVAQLTSGPNASKRVAAFNTYANVGFGRFRGWLQSPQRSGLLADGGTGAARGAGWAFLRYAADRHANGALPAEEAFWSALASASGTPAAAFTAVTGADIQVWYRDFVLAMFLDDQADAGPLGASGKWAQPSWSFRSVFTALNGSYPLSNAVLAVDGSSVDTYAARGGSIYLRFAVAAGATATLTFTPAWADPSAEIGYTLVRLK